MDEQQESSGEDWDLGYDAGLNTIAEEFLTNKELSDLYDAFHAPKEDSK